MAQAGNLKTNLYLNREIYIAFKTTVDGNIGENIEAAMIGFTCLLAGVQKFLRQQAKLPPEQRDLAWLKQLGLRYEQAWLALEAKRVEREDKRGRAKK